MMALMGILIGATGLAAWVYLLLGRGGFWRFREILPAADSMPSVRVAVVIPARDEAAGIARTVRSLLTQRFTGALHLFVVDDHSSDGTAALASRAAAQAGASGALTMIPAAPLPPGWTGKLWAVSQGVEAARSFSPEYILLTDADIEHGRDSVSSLVQQAQRLQSDLTSVMVRLHAGYLSEALLIPAFVFFFFKLYPPAWVNRAHSRTAAAAGGCMLVRPAALERVGGIEPIRAELIDDCALAHAIKASGGRVWMGLAPETRSTREYRSAGEIRDMIARSAYTQLQYSPLLLAGTVAGMAVIYFAGPVLAIAGHGAARWLGLGSWLLAAISFAPALRFYEKSVLLAPLLPAAAAFYVEATLTSAVRYYSGKGGHWKGRAQAAREGGAR
jgi:hopene-associated glycosyltransferase HpnB